MKVVSILVGERFQPLEAPCENIAVRTRPGAGGQSDAIVRSFGREVVFDRMFDSSWVDFKAVGSARRLAGAVDYVVFGKSRVCCLLLGLGEVALVNCRAGGARVVLQRFRTPDEDDHGFYRDQVIEHGEDVILSYEEGVARITSAGDVVWHRQLTWHDQLLRADAEALYFSTELEDGSSRDWSMAIQDGSERE